MGPQLNTGWYVATGSIFYYIGVVAVAKLVKLLNF